MERIQQAIEKARRERQGGADKPFTNTKVGSANITSKHNTTPNLPAEKTAGNKQAPAPKTKISKNSIDANSIVDKLRKAKTHGALKFEYTDTRVVSFSEKQLRAKRLIAGMPHDPQSEPYRQLRSQILKKMRAENLQSLAITSPTQNAGKTLTALNLAISLSQDVNQSVILVDLNLRNPGIANTLGLDNIKYGLMDYISGNKELKEILINPGYDRLVIAPGLPQSHGTSEILSSPKMLAFHQELCSRYERRLVIYDLPALLGSDDALVFTPHADATLLVVEDGGASKQELERSIKLLDDTRILGSIVNKIH